MLSPSIVDMTREEGGVERMGEGERIFFRECR